MKKRLTDFWNSFQLNLSRDFAIIVLPCSVRDTKEILTEQLLKGDPVQRCGVHALLSKGRLKYQSGCPLGLTR